MKKTHFLFNFLTLIFVTRANRGMRMRMLSSSDLKMYVKAQQACGLLAHDIKVSFSDTVSVGLPTIRATFQNQEMKE